MTINIYGTSFDATDALLAAGFWGEALGRSVNPEPRRSASLAVREGTATRRSCSTPYPRPSREEPGHLDLITDDFDTELARLRAWRHRTGRVCELDHPRRPRGKRVRSHPSLMASSWARADSRHAAAAA